MCVFAKGKIVLNFSVTRTYKTGMHQKAVYGPDVYPSYNTLSVPIHF